MNHVKLLKILFIVMYAVANISCGNGHSSHNSHDHTNSSHEQTSDHNHGHEHEEEDHTHADEGHALEDAQRAGFQAIDELHVVGVAEQACAGSEAREIDKAF